MASDLKMCLKIQQAEIRIYVKIFKYEAKDIFECCSYEKYFLIEFPIPWWRKILMWGFWLATTTECGIGRKCTGFSFKKSELEEDHLASLGHSILICKMIGFDLD